MRDESVQARSKRLLGQTRANLRQFDQDADVPVLAGPWLGEIAFELLYWLPFLRWALSEFPGLRDRLVVLSRGGAGPWYQGIGLAVYRSVRALRPSRGSGRASRSS